MLHPFGDDPDEHDARRRSREMLLEKSSNFTDGEYDEQNDFSARDVKDHRDFVRSIDLVLRPHFSSAELVEDQFYAGSHSPQIRSLVEQHGERLKPALEKIKKSYRIYIETASDAPLEREARRLSRRYFEEEPDANQLNFLKLKRYYEKVRTFNDIARTEWREVSKDIDTLIVINETRQLARKIDQQFIRPLALLIRQTDSFLDEMRMHIRVNNENVDPITRSRKIDIQYNPGIRYNIAAMLGLSDETESNTVTAEAPVEEEDNENRDFEGSLAANIVLETREHKLNRASIISVPILGSRDWNRTPHYRFEVPLVYFEQCVETFKKSYHVNIEEDNIKGPMNAAAAQVLKGQSDDVIVQYQQLITSILDDAAEKILDKDFPGLAKPEVFLYHCGATVLYRITLKYLRAQQLGEMFYLDANQNTSREFPEEIIKKILIDWWKKYFQDVAGENVDSYLTYSRQLEMVKREYRILYEEGVQMRKKEQPGVTYLGVEKWLRDNRNRVFGPRK
ncbi:MAG: hypothetical protein KDK27_17035, partial [Leptospiraceae bacterium]|nr:hypothetical protein [Leptospiraceae bacterium]